MIDCELEFCIYNHDKVCILESIELDNIGLCKSCILPKIPVHILEHYKQEVLQKVERASLPRG